MQSDFLQINCTIFSYIGRCRFHFCSHKKVPLGMTLVSNIIAARGFNENLNIDNNKFERSYRQSADRKHSKPGRLQWYVKSQYCNKAQIIHHIICAVLGLTVRCKWTEIRRWFWVGQSFDINASIASIHSNMSKLSLIALHTLKSISFFLDLFAFCQSKNIMSRIFTSIQARRLLH